MTDINGGGAFTFDVEGNQNVGPHGTVVANAFGLPKSMETSAGAYHFVYDGLGSRVQRKFGTDDVVSIAQIYERTRSTGAQVYRVVGPEGAVVEITRSTTGTADTVRYLHRDNLGSIVGLSNEVGALVETRRYDPFGGLSGFVLPGPSNTISGLGCSSTEQCTQLYRKGLTNVGATTTALGFTGHRTDVELGITDMIGRVYSPTLGRFLSADPLAAPGANAADSNPYSYVLNNPSSYVDPLGLDWELPGGGGWEPSPSPDPTPPGPWTQPGPGGGYPSTGENTWSIPRAPFNPVVDVDNRVAAARFIYSGSGSFYAQQSSSRSSMFENALDRPERRTWQNHRGRGRSRASISQFPANRVFADNNAWDTAKAWMADHPYATGGLAVVGLAGAGAGAWIGYGVITSGASSPWWIALGTVGAKLASDPRSQKIALGVREHLSQFAAFVNGQTWRVWGGTNWRLGFLSLLQNQYARFYINLTGPDGRMINVWAAISRAARDPNVENTSWELLQLYQNPQAYERMYFFFDNAVVKNPFLK